MVLPQVDSLLQELLTVEPSEDGTLVADFLMDLEPLMDLAEVDVEAMEAAYELGMESVGVGIEAGEIPCASAKRSHDMVAEEVKEEIKVQASVNGVIKARVGDLSQSSLICSQSASNDGLFNVPLNMNTDEGHHDYDGTKLPRPCAGASIFGAIVRASCQSSCQSRGVGAGLVERLGPG